MLRLVAKINIRDTPKYNLLSDENTRWRNTSLSLLSRTTKTYLDLRSQYYLAL